MGYIKEPIGVDFIIQSPPLTDLERKEISAFIKLKKVQSKQLEAQKSERIVKAKS